MRSPAKRWLRIASSGRICAARCSIYASKSGTAQFERRPTGTGLLSVQSSTLFSLPDGAEGHTLFRDFQVHLEWAAATRQRNDMSCYREAGHRRICCRPRSCGAGQACIIPSRWRKWKWRRCLGQFAKRGAALEKHISWRPSDQNRGVRQPGVLDPTKRTRTIWRRSRSKSLSIHVKNASTCVWPRAIGREMAVDHPSRLDVRQSLRRRQCLYTIRRSGTAVTVIA